MRPSWHSVHSTVQCYNKSTEIKTASFYSLIPLAHKDHHERSISRHQVPGPSHSGVGHHRGRFLGDLHHKCVTISLKWPQLLLPASLNDRPCQLLVNYHVNVVLRRESSPRSAKLTDIMPICPLEPRAVGPKDTVRRGSLR